SQGHLERVAVAIEVPHGALVEMLVDRGVHVYHINPKQLDRFRDRYTVAGAKDDRRDAFVLADAIRTDLHCFHRVQIDEESINLLRHLSRLDDDLRKNLNDFANQLHAQLYWVFPQLLQLCPAANEPWVWALLKLAPTPEKQRKLTPARLTKLLRAFRI